jgi:predicted peptidase
VYGSLTAQSLPFLTELPFVKSAEFKKLIIEKGVSEIKVPMSNGQDWFMKVYLPEIDRNTKVPLVIALNWAGNGTTYKEYFDCLAYPALQELDAIIVAPSDKGYHWVDTVNEVRLIQLVKALKRKYPINNDQVLVTGYSNGGIGAWHLAKQYPNIFKAAIPMGGLYSGSKFKVPLIVIHGTDDDLFPLEKVETAISESMAIGSNIKIIALENRTHREACLYKDALRNAALELRELYWMPKSKTKKRK